MSIESQRHVPAILPRSGRVALIGTSLVQQNHWADARNIQTSARGWMSWAEVLSGGRFRTPVFHDPRVIPGWEPSGQPGRTRGFSGFNFGVSGQKAIEIERRLDRVLAADFDIIIVDAGTNDMMVETKETILAIRERICRRLLDAGKTVLLLPVLARGTEKWVAGSAPRAKAHWINRMGLAFADAHVNCHVLDWNEAWVDPMSPDGSPRDGYSNDGTHFSILGGYHVGKWLAGRLQQILPPLPVSLHSRDDRYDPVDNPLGCLFPNPFLDGEGSSGKCVSLEGSIMPAGLCRRNDGSGNWQRLAVGVGEGRVVFDTPQSLSAGTWVEAACQVEVSASSCWRQISLELVDPSETGLTATAMAPPAESFPFLYPTETWTGVLRTPPIRMAASGDRVRLTLRTRLADGQGDAALKVSAVELRPVLSPLLSSGV
ncbi:SGNH/GDSL hydrolase family protein [Martelella endophytica]|uniref:SGNH/GDSL hydrolase family protein n=1 Tax=Martelella endophytica TaxID=1486262 RepID=UPI0009E2BA5D|nr:SGNH/GDSL hydrolase family protein [Martelella endophytica]